MQRNEKKQPTLVWHLHIALVHERRRTLSPNQSELTPQSKRWGHWRITLRPSTFLPPWFWRVGRPPQVYTSHTRKGNGNTDMGSRNSYNRQHTHTHTTHKDAFHRRFLLSLRGRTPSLSVCSLVSGVRWWVWPVARQGRSTLQRKRVMPLS